MASDLVLDLRVVPNAARTEFRLEDSGLKVRLAAPAVDGKANAALVQHLAKSFGVRAQDVTIERGEKSRSKRVRIVAPAHVPAEIEALARQPR